MRHVKRLVVSIDRGQSGVILIPVLIILVLASLTVVPLLYFMNTGITAASSQGRLTQELYSAEAGVWDGVWKIQNMVTGLPEQPSDPALQYSLSADLNGKSVNVSVSNIDSMTYRVVSAATDPNTAHQTSIESYLKIVNISMFTQEAITSPTGINIQPNGTIEGNVWSPLVTDKNDTITGSINNSPVPGWPTISESSMLSTFYGKQVNQSNPFTNTTLDISQPGCQGPLYIDNGNPNTNYTLTGSGTLQGTIFVAGNLSFDKNAHVNLNGQTIFVQGTISSSPSASFSNSGAIIALGSISFQPMVSSNGFIYVMSVNGQLNFQPNGNFVGSIAGDTLVNLQPNCTLAWEPPPSTLNVPGSDKSNLISGLKTWKIN